MPDLAQPIGCGGVPVPISQQIAWRACLRLYPDYFDAEDNDAIEQLVVAAFHAVGRHLGLPVLDDWEPSILGWRNRR